MTQGRGDGEEWVTSFMVSYSMDAFHWKYITDMYGNQRVRSTLNTSPLQRYINENFFRL